MSVNSEGETVPVLEFVDDLIEADTDPEGLQLILDLTHEIAGRYHIQFGESKTKVMIINGKKDTPKPVFRLGDMEIEYVDTYKYLGE